MYKSIVFVLFLIQIVCCSVNMWQSQSQPQSQSVSIIPIPAPDTNFVAAPVWDSQTQSVYAVDFVSPTGVNSIYRYDYNTGQIYGAQITGEESPSFIIPVKGCNNEFIVGLLDVIKVITWDGISSTATVLRTLLNVKGHLNYALADEKGHLFFGTINNTIFCSAPAEFATYRYANGQLTTIFTNIKTTTGLTIDYKRKKFYHANACQYQIVELDYDCKTGDICNPRVVYDFTNSGITPYPLALGLNVGTNGLLYCTLYESGVMFIIDPITSAVVDRITFPSPGLSDVIFGGPHYNQVMVSATRYIVNSYGGGLLEDRSTDDTFFKVDGLDVTGYDSPRVSLDTSNCPNKNCCGK